MSIKKNFFYNSILSISNYIFPFLTFPYVSRVLGVDNLGKCNFVDGVINYFLLFASLGIGAVGIREIAKSKNHERMGQIFSSLLFFNFICTAVVCIVYIFTIIYVVKLGAYRELLYMGLAKIISTLFLIEWFFAGIENFRFITIRSILIKIGYIILVFLLVKEPEDYKLYFFLTVLITIINALFNLFYSRKFVKFNFNNLSITRYVKPIMIMGVYGLLTYMYTSFNVIYLGFISGDREVGYYTTATKIYTILLSIFTAFTTVMLPRMSQLVAEKRIAEMQDLIDKSYDTLFAISIPILVVCTFLAPQIIDVIAGKGFEGAIVPMQIVMPLILIIGIAQILIIQILMPFNNDKYIFINSIIGAVVGIALNLLLVDKLHSIGSSIVLLVSELAVVIGANYFVKKKNNFTLPYRKIFVNLFFAIPHIFFCWIVTIMSNNSIIILFSVSFLSVIYFVFIQKVFIKNTMLLDLEKKTRSSLSHIFKK